MTDSNYALGVDIGTSHVRAVLAYHEDGNTNILGYEEDTYNQEYEALHLGRIVNSENASNTINRVIERLSEKLQEPIDRICVNVSMMEIGSSTKKVDFVKEDGQKFTINNAIVENLINSSRESFKNNSKDNELLHAIPADFFRDEVKYTKNPIGSTVNKLSCNVKNVYIKPQFLDEYYNGLREVQTHGLKNKQSVLVENLLFSPLADMFSLLSPIDKEEGVIIINIGAGLTKFSVFSENAPRLIEMLPFGGDNITQDIEQAFNINQKEAELLKKACMSRDSREIEINEVMTVLGKDDLPPKRFLEKNVAEVAEWRLKEIIALIHQKLLNAGINEIPPRGIILAGDMAKLSVLNYLVRKEFATDAVRIGISTRNIAGTANLELAHPRYATAIGLVLSQFVPFDGRVKTVSIQGATKQSRSNNLGKNLWNRLIGGDRDNLDQRYAD